MQSIWAPMKNTLAQIPGAFQHYEMVEKTKSDLGINVPCLKMLNWD